MKYVFMFWEDAKVDTNKVYGVSEIDEFHLADIVAKHFEKVTGNKCAHVELRAITDNPERFDIEVPRIGLEGDV